MRTFETSREKTLFTPGPLSTSRTVKQAMLRDLGSRDFEFIQVVGDMAYELGTEQGQVKLGGHQVSIEHRVTNIYRRESGAWKIVHHHTDVSPAMLDVISRLQAER